MSKALLRFLIARARVEHNRGASSSETLAIMRQMVEQYDTANEGKATTQATAVR